MRTAPRSLLASLLLATSVLAEEPKAQPPTPTAPTPDFTATDATVSVLEPAGAECEWSKLDPPSQQRRLLARLPAGCQGAATAWSRDGKSGAVRFWRGAVSMPAVGKPTFPERFPGPEFRDRLFTVDLVTGATAELPLPPKGEIIEFGFDPGNRLFALTLQHLTPDEEAAREVEVDGTAYRFQIRPGTHPMLAHAYAFQGGSWARLESRASSDATGTGVLTHRTALGERSNRALDPRFTPEEIDDEEALDQLYALTPEKPEGEWGQLEAGGQKLAVWATPYGKEFLATGLLRKLEKGKAVALPKLPFQANDMVSVRARGPFLLVSLADSGGHPRMYKGQKLVWSSETARGVTFWPK